MEKKEGGACDDLEEPPFFVCVSLFVFLNLSKIRSLYWFLSSAVVRMQFCSTASSNWLVSIYSVLLFSIALPLPLVSAD